MACKLHIESEAPITAGLPASFRVVFTSDQAIEVGGQLRLIYDYRGSDRRESFGQVTGPQAINYVSCISDSGIRPDLQTYSVAHSYKPPWSEEPECFAWLDLLGPEISLNCHVVEATFAGASLSPGEDLVFGFGENPSGYLLSRKSYQAYPIWAIFDPLGDGHWQAAGRAAVQIKPSAPSRLVITLPSITCVGEETTPHVQAFDAVFNPVDGPTPLRLATGSGVDLDRDTGLIRFTEAGEKHLVVDGESPLVIETSSSLVLDTPPEDRIFWGDVHGHANACDGGVRSPEEYFAWGRDVMALDFCALTTHDFGIALSDPETQWERLQATANRYNVPGSFVTFVAWEASHIGLPSGQPVGHKNLMFRGDRAPFFNGSSYGTHRVQVDYQSYAELIGHLQNQDCLVIPHHPLNPVLPGGLGTNWNEFWAERERVVEIYSLWGVSEEMDSPDRTADAVEGTSVLAALVRGHRLGFIAGSDTHDGRPANPHEPWSTAATSGLTAVIAPSLTREAIYDALWHRSCYGTTGVRIVLITNVGGLPMGKTKSISPADPLIREREIRIHVIGSSEIERADVIRNGQVVHTFTGERTQETRVREMESTWVDHTPLPMIALADATGQRFVFYYIRVHQRDGHRAWGSPVWFELEAPPARQ
jgi:hypothetical protein